MASFLPDALPMRAVCRFPQLANQAYQPTTAPQGIDHSFKVSVYELRKLVDKPGEEVIALEVTRNIRDVNVICHLNKFEKLKCLRMISDLNLLGLPTACDLSHLTITFRKGFNAMNMRPIISCSNLEFLNIHVNRTIERFLGAAAMDQFGSNMNEEGVAMLPSKLKTLFLTEGAPHHFNDEALLQIFFRHFFLKNIAIRYEYVKFADLKDYDNFASETVYIMSRCPNLEFLSLQGVKYIVRENINSNYCFENLQHLFLDNCNFIRKIQFDWMLTAMPKLHYLKLTYTPVQVLDFEQFINDHKSLLRISFYSNCHLPYEMTIADLVEVLVKGKPPRVEKLCLCGFYETPNPDTDEDLVQMLMQIRDLLTKYNPCGSFPCLKEEKCNDNCKVYCRTDLACDEHVKL